jgi:hypothetical protein
MQLICHVGMESPRCRTGARERRARPPGPMTALALGVARLYRTRYEAVHTEPGEARGDLSQLHQGTAEYCVLALLCDGDATASTGPRAVRQRRGLVTSEGTIYPLLTRLRKDQLVTTTWREYEKAAKESRKDDVTLVSLLRRRGSKNWGGLCSSRSVRSMPLQPLGHRGGSIWSTQTRR